MINPIYMKKNAWLLCGPTGTGKSTLREELLKFSEDALVSSVDDFVMSIRSDDGLTFDQAFEKHQDEAQLMANKVILRAIDERTDLIIDQGNLTSGRRSAAAAMLSATHNVVAIVPDLDVNTRMSYVILESRRICRPENEIRANITMEREIAAWDPPTEEEGFFAIFNHEQVRSAILKLEEEPVLVM